MREIKFKVWHPETKIMGRPLSITSICMFKTKPPKSLIWLQFTGLKDRNGVEIYEGDVLSFVSQRKFGFPEDGIKCVLPPVEFGNFTIRNESMYKFIGFHIGGASIQQALKYDTEVIGNIHQNPDLLASPERKV